MFPYEALLPHYRNDAQYEHFSYPHPCRACGKMRSPKVRNLWALAGDPRSGTPVAPRGVITRRHWSSAIHEIIGRAS